VGGGKVEGNKERKVTFLSGFFPSESLPLLYPEIKVTFISLFLSFYKEKKNLSLRRKEERIFFPTTFTPVTIIINKLSYICSILLIPNLYTHRFNIL
jgi:hypothetical protein